MKVNGNNTWATRLDKYCTYAGALVPIGIVVGNVGFELLVSFVGVFWIVRCFVAKVNPINNLARHPLVLPWALWFTVIVLSLVLNGAGSKGWAHDVVFVRNVLFGLALLDISQRQPVGKFMLYGLAAGVCWAAINTIFAYLLGADLLGKPLTRYTGKLKEASRISGLSAFSAAFFGVWAFSDNRLAPKVRFAVVLLALIAFAQIVQTQVRTALLGSVTGILFGVTCHALIQRMFKIAVSIIIAIVGLTFLVFFWGNFWNLDSFYDRIYYWKVAWQMWLDHPLLGVGISSFQDAYKEMAASGRIPQYIAPDGSVWKLGEQTHAHNMVMMLLSCTGLLGLASFLWLFIQAVRLTFKDRVEYRTGLVVWPVAYLMIGVTGFNIYHSWYQALLAFWLVFIGVREVAYAER